jgi:hypothetical protein
MHVAESGAVEQQDVGTVTCLIDGAGHTRGQWRTQCGAHRYGSTFPITGSRVDPDSMESAQGVHAVGYR